jgi:hypothetical protein
MVQVENTCFKERLFMFMFSTRDTTKRGEIWVFLDASSNIYTHNSHTHKCLVNDIPKV